MNTQIDPIDAHVRALLFSGAALNIGAVSVLAMHLPASALITQDGSDPWWCLVLPLLVGVPISAFVVGLLVPAASLVWGVLNRSNTPTRYLFSLLSVSVAFVFICASVLPTFRIATVSLPGLGVTYLLAWHSPCFSQRSRVTFSS
jgi:predicted membrane channel-forming protein YqfA (hemolysin III family)